MRATGIPRFVFRFSFITLFLSIATLALSQPQENILPLLDSGGHRSVMNETTYNPPTPRYFVRDYELETYNYQELTTITLPGGVPLVMVRIPAGSFLMGSHYSERFHKSSEWPIHPVTIANDFYMGKYEVTQGQWLALMGTWRKLRLEAQSNIGENHPICFDKRDRAIDSHGFIWALNKHVASTGQGPATFRLPSEAEWEYACRAGSQTRFFFGDSLEGNDDDDDSPAGTLPGNRSDYMWYGGNNTPSGSKEVGMKMPNPFGLYDMSGNVSELCEYWGAPSYWGASADGAVCKHPRPFQKVARGGGFSDPAGLCRSAKRALSGHPLETKPFTGFRLVRPLD